LISGGRSFKATSGTTWNKKMVFHCSKIKRKNGKAVPGEVNSASFFSVLVSEYFLQMEEPFRPKHQPF
jgi:hypothetical protein